MRPTNKRYVLLESTNALAQNEWREVSAAFEEQHSRVKLIPLDPDGLRVVLKTDVEGARKVVEACRAGRVGGREIATLLVSGAIGNLKRASEKRRAERIGKVPQ